MKAGAGRARDCVCEAAAAVLCVLTSSLTTFVAAAWAGRVNGDDCARTAEVEKGRVPLMAAMARDRDCCMADRRVLAGLYTAIAKRKCTIEIFERVG